MKTCEYCKKPFKISEVIDGKRRILSSRKFCLLCSPFGTKDPRNPGDREKDKLGVRKCPVCSNTLALTAENFHPDKSHKLGFAFICRACKNRASNTRYAKQKQQLFEYKGAHCIKCGYSHTAALQFHHRDPNQKDFELSVICTLATKNKWEKIKEELDKCDVLCANCHAVLHWEQNQQN